MKPPFIEQNALGERHALLGYHGILEQPVPLIIGRPDLPHPRLHSRVHTKFRGPDSYAFKPITRRLS
jgi:hypothetical protein